MELRDLTLVDAILLLVLLYFGLNGLREGFVAALADLVGWLLALGVAIRFYAEVAPRISPPLPPGLAAPLAFIGLWFITSVAAGLIERAISDALWSELHGATWNRALGPLPGLAKGVILLALVLATVVAAPVPGQLKDEIARSRIGGLLLAQAGVAQGQIAAVIDQGFSDALGLLTVKPAPGERISLRFSVRDAPIDAAAEVHMLELVNQERARRGLRPLLLDEGLREVARAHARDMLARGYFSHDTPEGKDPFDRMAEAGIRFQVAGENIALAPTVELAHRGLMDSPGHRANILNPAFGHAGIGVADGGFHGKMFAQEFRE